MKKEILTIEKIKQDYKTQYLSNRKTTWLSLIGFVFAMTIGLGAWILWLINPSIDYLIELLLLSALVIIYVYICITMLFKSRWDYLNISRGKVEIVTDKLVGSNEETVHMARASYQQVYSLEFASHGKYTIGSWDNNTFSDEYHMSDRGIYLSSKEGDEFYLVIGRKGKILLAYNTKFFELQS